MTKPTPRPYEEVVGQLTAIYKGQGMGALTAAFNAHVMRAKLTRWEALALSDSVFASAKAKAAQP